MMALFGTWLKMLDKANKKDSRSSLFLLPGHDRMTSTSSEESSSAHAILLGLVNL